MTTSRVTQRRRSGGKLIPFFAVLTRRRVVVQTHSAALAAYFGRALDSQIGSSPTWLDGSIGSLRIGSIHSIHSIGGVPLQLSCMAMDNVVTQHRHRSCLTTPAALDGRASKDK